MASERGSESCPPERRPHPSATSPRERPSGSRAAGPVALRTRRARTRPSLPRQLSRPPHPSAAVASLPNRRRCRGLLPLPHADAADRLWRREAHSLPRVDRPAAEAPGTGAAAPAMASTAPLAASRHGPRAARRPPRSSHDPWRESRTGTLGRARHRDRAWVDASGPAPLSEARYAAPRAPLRMKSFLLSVRHAAKSGASSNPLMRP